MTRAIVRRAMAACVVAIALAGPAPAGAQAGQARDSAARAQLERQFGERVARAVRQRLQLTEDQMERLQRTNRAFESRRREVVRQERDVRLALRGQLAPGATPDQQRVSQLIEQAIRLQRQRLDLVESEQRELAQFLTPVQRARYLDLQERLRHRVEEVRRGHGGRGGGAPPRRLRGRS